MTIYCNKFSIYTLLLKKNGKAGVGVAAIKTTHEYLYSCFEITYQHRKSLTYVTGSHPSTSFYFKETCYTLW